MAGNKRTIDFSLCGLDRDPSVPVLDRDLKSLGERLMDGLQQHGAVQLTNSGFDFTRMTKVYDLADGFFSLPESTKRKYLMNVEKTLAHGYIPMQQEVQQENGPKDVKESYAMVSEIRGTSNPDAEVPGFSDTMLQVKNEYMEIARRSMECITLAAGLEKDVFKPYFARKSDTGKEYRNSFKLVNYPVLLENEDIKDNIRCGKHKDKNMLTVLVQDAVGGLQFQNESGQWFDSKPVPHTVCLHVGYALEVLLSGQLRAWQHRVVFQDEESRMKTRRAAILFISGPKGMVFRPLDGSDKYPPLSLGDTFKATTDAWKLRSSS